MFITRTDTLLEIVQASGARLSLALDRIRSASIAAQRDPSGGLATILIVDHCDGSPSTWLPGPIDMLLIVHERIVEAMRDIPPAPSPVQVAGTRRDIDWCPA